MGHHLTLETGNYFLSGISPSVHFFLEFPRENIQIHSVLVLNLLLELLDQLHSIYQYIHWYALKHEYEEINCPQVTQHRSERSTLALKPRACITRSPKQGYQWPHVHQKFTQRCTLGVSVFARQDSIRRGVVS